MKIEPPKLSSGLEELYWKTYLDFRGFWQGLPATTRRALLALPVIKHPSAPGSGDADFRSLEIRSDVDNVLETHGIPPRSPKHHLLVRLYQVAAACPSIAGGATLNELGEHLKWLQFSKTAVCHFTKDPFFSRFSILNDFQAPLNLDRLGSRNRIRRFLEIRDGESGVSWEVRERRSGNSYQSSHSLFSGVHVTACAKALLRPVFESRTPIALEELIGRLTPDQFKGAIIAKALRGIALWGFVLLDYSADTGELRLNLWPGLAAKLDDRPLEWAPKESPAPPAQVYTEAFAATDMAVVVAEAAAKPLRLKQGRRIELLASVERALARQLTHLPLNKVFDLPEGADVQVIRIQSVLGLLLDLGFMEYHGTDAWTLAVTPSGRTWLELSPSKRLQRVMDLLKAVRWSPKIHERLSWGFCPLPDDLRPISNDAPSLNMETEICEAWRLVPEGSWVDLYRWLEWLTQQHNPILKASGPTQSVLVWMRDSFGRTELVEQDAEILEDKARHVLSLFFSERLLTLGGVCWGVTPPGRILFQITPAGRYYLGQLDTFPESMDTAPGAVVLQPNFEIVFLGPNLAAEAKVSVFCERLAHGTGSLFKITKVSVLRAVQNGTTLERIIESLDTVSSKGIPSNVRTEITAWAQSRRTFTVRAAMLLTCTAPQVALKVHGILKKNSVLLNETTMELTQPLTSVQRRKLEAAGLFLED
jgi:hypothetical protein